ncbi:hypothetical protein, partial [Bradyrhizobium sp. LA2.1]|uniref:hypothetical protein n=1 Tax=Bradyrhizobium sp. LA2.1 TaxID=3156376 RepID=UPI00339650E9
NRRCLNGSDAALDTKAIRQKRGRHRAEKIALTIDPEQTSIVQAKGPFGSFKASNCVADRTWWVYSRPIFGSRWARCGLLELDHTLSVIKRGTFGIARAPRRRRVFCCYLSVPI